MPDWTAADLPSFAGRTAIVTGANSGLGEVTACELARVGAHIIVAVRNTGKGEAAAERMTGPKPAKSRCVNSTCRICPRCGAWPMA